jgi:hypothetical protein
MEIHNKFLRTQGRGPRMRHLKKAVVISVISIFLLAGAIPAFCTPPTPAPTPVPATPRTVDEQRFVPETPQQRINKANDDALRYQQQVPPPGGEKKKEKSGGSTVPPRTAP